MHNRLRALPFSNPLTLSREIRPARFLVKRRSEKAMLRLLIDLLKDEEGYTSAECGILACLTIIFAEKLVS